MPPTATAAKSAVKLSESSSRRWAAGLPASYPVAPREQPGDKVQADLAAR
jgi:hypothetical protein